MSNIEEWAKRVRDNIGIVFFGKDDVVDKILTGLLCGGHVLLEDVPGLGKTILARAVSISLGGVFNRIQATPDLLPNDVLGLSIYSPKEEVFKFTPGPINSNIVLVDEINRATPRTQSAFLEAMAESQISIDGVVRPLPNPFFLIATENPTEFEGTFPLPEAQKDRFFMTINIGYPSREAEAKLLESHRRITHPITDLKPVSNLEELIEFKKEVVNIFVDDTIKLYILDLIEATRRSKFFSLGVSPRGSLALYKGSQAYAALKGRNFVIPDDIKEIFNSIMLQRVILKPEFLIKGVTVSDALEDILYSIPIPQRVTKWIGQNLAY
ncbi:MoxR family ATPase [Thiospirochaeta perfilievii]|uniref:MoxR family ATPase n=1 Tax=Thiospirochaeta perfilievii TaxID=252967 RepID=A0A5C1Q889_9SPIO|nr:MoxR family ATPase [Thiospirochaeta perfilievii]QEN03701.1 MoxR family ATPase [Thiospirochaeta perfilievii]